ncbi:MAG: DEAD/DEAH box helicase [Euryarchaeota archaeon]|nr:DEAD/DEAH box helicase [Euryarchaeota archaeon]MBU4143312.1 DEAD/DEAH box helicase [Candidatus Thermoplasmatota archaeon]
MSGEGSFNPGEIIEMRSRLWRVDSIIDDILEATPIDGLIFEQQKFFMPFENIKPGKLSAPNPNLIGNYAQQKLLHHAYKLDLLHSTAPILSLQRSRVIPEEYQLVPLIMSMDMPKVRLLIADDVGLGKTIEAGLIIKELLARNRAKRVLVVCPANLREQWKNSMDYFFHLDARIISTRHRRGMERELPPGANPWEHYDLLITSVDYVKNDPTRNYVFEQDWDIVVVDEAHNCAKPHQMQRSQKVDMKRFEFVRDLAKECKHLLLLTATPHNGYSDSYGSLFGFLGMDLTSGPVHNPRILKDRARDYVCQRRRKDVMEWIESSGGRVVPFPKRDQKEISILLSPQQKEAIDKVDDFTKYLSSVAQAEGQGHKKLMAGWTIMHFHKRALSSPAALIKSLQNRIRKITEDEHAEDSGLTLSEAKATALDEDTGEKLSEEEASTQLDKEIFGTTESRSTELALLEGALECAKKITPARDMKLRELKSRLSDRLKINPKLIIFTKYKDTLDYLEKQIGKDNDFKDTRIVTIYGEMTEAHRREKFIQFEDAAKAVMIATDCISEGIDLQYLSSQLIHYEIPWNPNRLEQRNGRIDRYGQKESEVYIRIFYMEDPLDAAILKVLVKKAEQIRKDYGFSPPFFGDDQTVIDLILEMGLDIPYKSQTSLLEFEKGDKATVEINPMSDETIERIKEESFFGQTKLDLAEVQERLEETRKQFGNQEQIEKFIISALNRFSTKITKHNDLYDLEITDDTLLAPGIEKEMKNISFDPNRSAKSSRIGLIDLGHPLVRQLIERLKTSAFEDTERYERTAYITSKSVKEVTAIYHLLVRYTVATKPISILEEIVPIARTVYGKETLDDNSLTLILDSSPERTTQSEITVKDTLQKALSGISGDSFGDTIEQRRRNLCLERRRLKERLEKEGSAEWAKGIDNIKIASIDLLTVTLYFPIPGGA